MRVLAGAENSSSRLWHELQIRLALTISLLLGRRLVHWIPDDSLLLALDFDYAGLGELLTLVY